MTKYFFLPGETEKTASSSENNATAKPINDIAPGTILGARENIDNAMANQPIYFFIFDPLGTTP